MELQGDLQEHVPLILSRFKNSFGSLFATETKQTQKHKQKPRKDPAIKVHEQQTIFFHNEAGCPNAVAGLGEIHCIRTMTLRNFLIYPSISKGLRSLSWHLFRKSVGTLYLELVVMGLGSDGCFCFC